MKEKIETSSDELLEIPYILYEGSENRHEAKDKRIYADCEEREKRIVTDYEEREKRICNCNEKKEKRLCNCIICLVISMLLTVGGIFVRDYYISEKHDQEITDLNDKYIDFLSQYDIESYAQDGTGTNILGNANEVNNGAGTMDNEEEKGKAKED